MSSREFESGWSDGVLPANVRLGAGSRIAGPDAFKRFFSKCDVGLSLGDRTLADGARFGIGEAGRILVGEDCYLDDCILLAEQEIRIGRHVMIGWNTTVSDSDFHPLAAAERVLDAIALSPVGGGRPRPKIICRPVMIGDDVYIGPACTILKGVEIGSGAYIEPGSVVTRSIPPMAHVRGNPATWAAAEKGE
jgi:acetyltransferase-like isoleucine patch superfamily enzyme